MIAQRRYTVEDLPSQIIFGGVEAPAAENTDKLNQLLEDLTLIRSRRCDLPQVIKGGTKNKGGSSADTK